MASLKSLRYSVVASFVMIGVSARFAVAADPAQVAAQILDQTKPNAEREALIAARTVPADKLIIALVDGMNPGTKEEYVRIPWIWRVAIAAGKRNELEELAKVMDVSVPEPTGGLDDWRAVVIGGGIINGITQAGDWPDQRITAAIEENKGLASRYRRALELASTMADDSKIARGTRYDAIRMLGVEPWGRRGEQILKYLRKGTNSELQMGAVSALGDIREPVKEVSVALFAALPDLNATNRALALAAMVRTEARANHLLDAVGDGRVKVDSLGAKTIETLKTHSAKTVRDRMADLIKDR